MFAINIPAPFNVSISGYAKINTSPEESTIVNFEDGTLYFKCKSISGSARNIFDIKNGQAYIEVENISITPPPTILAGGTVFKDSTNIYANIDVIVCNILFSYIPLAPNNPIAYLSSKNVTANFLVSYNGPSCYINIVSDTITTLNGSEDSYLINVGDSTNTSTSSQLYVNINCLNLYSLNSFAQCASNKFGDYSTYPTINIHANNWESAANQISTISANNVSYLRCNNGNLNIIADRIYFDFTSILDNTISGNFCAGTGRLTIKCATRFTYRSAPSETDLMLSGNLFYTITCSEFYYTGRLQGASGIINADHILGYSPCNIIGNISMQTLDATFNNDIVEPIFSADTPSDTLTIKGDAIKYTGIGSKIIDFSGSNFYLDVDVLELSIR